MFDRLRLLHNGGVDAGGVDAIAVDGGAVGRKPLAVRHMDLPSGFAEDKLRALTAIINVPPPLHSIS